ncbi:dihydrolipoyl dehydrogenase [Allohahella sp. A8]|uniref:dihydrolipoyl dehydrogenase n=1 Tax=Allohahella sp. A8 TaxID=3141461 RepID=UPI000C0B2C1F|nr:dihydrolipoyl dehydrogenase [Hahellaceae bacterium]|tara:strand:+ start:69706 stop:71169 length:1464 start_codon:yes stop_codon:yes gene_type:complete
MEEVDVVVIGAGTAGLSAYRRVVTETDSVRLIEAGAYGTTCARNGCMPSKLLIAAAEAAHAVDASPLFGLRDVNYKVDGRAVMQRVRSERDRFVSSVLESMVDFPEAHKVLGQASFIDANTVQVKPEGQPSEPVVIRAQRFIIAIGAAPFIPDMLRPAADRLITTEHVFELDTLPASVAVFGAGIIGLELGQALHRLGVRVRIFGRGGGIGGIEDEQIRRTAQKVFIEAGLKLHPSANVSDLKRVDGGVAISFQEDESAAEKTETFEYVLAATGRRPAMDVLNPAAAGIELDDRGQPIFCRYTMQTSQKHIFIVGDASTDIPLLHEAADMGRIAGRNAASWPTVRAGKRRTPLAIVFCDPQIARVGHWKSEFDHLAPNGYAVGRASFENQGRSRVLGRNRGELIVYGAFGSAKFLGAEIFGPSAEHLAHTLAWVLQQGMTVDAMLDLPFYHPTLEEILRTALRALDRELLSGPTVVIEEHIDCGPGS